MIHGGESLEHGSADGAQDQERGQTGVAHQRASQKPAVLVPALHAPGERAHDPVRQRDGGVLTPPAIHN